MVKKLSMDMIPQKKAKIHVECNDGFNMTMTVKCLIPLDEYYPEKPAREVSFQTVYADILIPNDYLNFRYTESATYQDNTEYSNEVVFEYPAEMFIEFMKKYFALKLDYCGDEIPDIALLEIIIDFYNQAMQYRQS